MTVAPDRMAPADDLAASIKIGCNLNRHRRAEGRMCHLIGARPLYTHGVAFGRPCQQDRVKRDIISAIMSVTTGTLHVFDGDVINRKSEDTGQIDTLQIDRLTVGPNMDSATVPSRHGAGRGDRSVRNVGAGVLPRDG